MCDYYRDNGFAAAQRAYDAQMPPEDNEPEGDYNDALAVCGKCGDEARIYDYSNEDENNFIVRCDCGNEYESSGNEARAIACWNEYQAELEEDKLVMAEREREYQAMPSI